eukprot:scaffold80196_cov67-Phaeocystis_antarctica.AAC.6
MGRTPAVTGAEALQLRLGLTSDRKNPSTREELECNDYCISHVSRKAPSNETPQTSKLPMSWLSLCDEPPTRRAELYNSTAT